MSHLLSVAFEFRQGDYFMIVRTRKKKDSTEYHVRVMSSRLDRLLYHNHVFTEKSGLLYPAAQPVNKEQQELLAAVLEALKKHLKETSKGISILL